MKLRLAAAFPSPHRIVKGRKKTVLILKQRLRELLRVEGLQVVQLFAGRLVGGGA